MIPVLQALVLAEKVYEDKSGQKIIAGTFNGFEIRHHKAPEPDDNGILKLMGGSAGSPYAYISLTDVCDGTVVSLQFVSLTKNQVIFTQDILLNCKNRLHTIEIVSALPDLRPFAEAGTYVFEVVCEGEILGSSRLVVTEIKDE